jgi:exopolyphosphatase/guanosine-5'-triphosphate,3'-diphosphate pyrophosphatase
MESRRRVTVESPTPPARRDAPHAHRMKLAAFDVGTNTVLMLAVEFDHGRAPRVLADRSRITRLGRGVDRGGALDPESAARTLDAIVEFAREASALGVERIVGVATAALRDARDGRDFIAEVRKRADVPLDIITGDAEAELSYLAVKRGLAIEPQARLLIADIGGGSTELIAAEPGRELAKRSLQIGSVRLTERFMRSDPPQEPELDAIVRTVDEALERLGWQFTPDRLIGIAGTVTTICAVALGLESYDHAVVHGRELSLDEVHATLRRFISMPLNDRKKLPGLHEARADVIIAGTIILDRVMEYFKANSVTVSDQGVRWGLVWRELEGSATAC